MAELSEHLDLCAALAAGSIETADRKRFAEHLAEGCDDCEQRLSGYERSTLLLTAALPLSAPSPAVRDRVIDAMTSGVPAPAPVLPLPMAPPVRRPAPRRAFELAIPPGMWAVAGGGLVIVLLVVGAVKYTSGQVDHLRREIASSNQVITGLNQQLEDLKHWNGVYESPEARVARLVSTSRSEIVLRGRATYDPRSQRALFVFSDLRAPRGRVYQLWSIEGPRLTSLGVIRTDELGRGVVRVVKAGDPNRLTEFGVSLENRGGSTRSAGPTGPMVMSGRVEG
jgi:hypothetical protein